MQKYISLWTKSSFLFLLFILPRLGTTQTDKALLTDNLLKNRLDSTVNICAKAYMSDPNSVGLSIGIFLNGKSHRFNYGELKKGSGKLPTANTFYGIGSIDKTFATTLLAQAVVEKRIKLSDGRAWSIPEIVPVLRIESLWVLGRKSNSNSTPL